MAYKILTVMSECEEHGTLESHILVDSETTYDELFAELVSDEYQETSLRKGIFLEIVLANQVAELLNKAGLN